MAIIHAWTSFTAADLNTSPKGLAPGLGVLAKNLDTRHNDLRARNDASAVYTVTGTGTQQISIYRLGRDVASDTLYWLSSNHDVDYVRGPIAGDTTERTYYTGEAKPRFTDNTFLSGSPLPSGFRDLGVPAPAGTMHATLTTAGTGPNETRVYTETFVRSNGEESAPEANTVTITCPGGSTVTLSTLTANPGGTTGITNRRGYVSTGGGVFQRFADQVTATATMVDNSGTRGLELATGGSDAHPTWLTPPDTLIGLIDLWNGMLGGFDGKSYRLCVPYTPHAWPIEYEGIVPDTIVGSAKFLQNWVLVTTGTPRLVTGSVPPLSDVPIALNQAGVSKRSVVGVGHGVMWASNEGMAYVGQYGTKLLTDTFIDPALWRSKYNPSTIIGAAWNRYYVGFYTTSGGGHAAFMLDTANPVGIIDLDHIALGVFSDTVQQALYMVGAGNVIKKWDAGAALNLTFTTGIVRGQDDTNPGVAMVVGTTYPITFQLYGDGTLRHTQTVTSDAPFRLPGGYVASEWQVKLSGGTGPIEAVVLAHDMVDLP